MSTVRYPDPAVMPILTHLQWLLLDSIISFGKKQVSATSLRHQIHDTWNAAGPRFYQAIKRLEAVGAIRVLHQVFDVGGGEVTRTFYSITETGRDAWQEVVDFYRKRGV